MYGKVLAGTGKRAVVLLNRTSSAKDITVRWSDLGLTGAAATVRDLWSRADVGSYATSCTANVPAGGSVMLTVTGGTEASGSTYTGTSSFSGVVAGATGPKVVDVACTNTFATARTATLKVNGRTTTTVSFPPTGSSRGGITLQVALSKGSSNTLTFTNAPTLADITVKPLPGMNGTLVVGKQSGRCLDLFDSTITNGTQAEIWDCNGGSNQAWTYTSRKELVVYGNKCLDAYNLGTTNGTKVVIWDCHGGANQKWNVNSDGTITNANAGLCLDVNGAGTANRSPIVLWSCSGADNQSWTLT